MSMMPLCCGRGAGASDPFSLDGFNPFSGGTYPATLSAGHRVGEPSPFVGAAALVDWKETAAAHVFKVDLPGVNKDEVKVEVEEGRILQIRGERTRERKQKTDTWYCFERCSGSFMRRFVLPGNANVDQVTTAMENGVLTVTVPKEAMGKPSVISVEISG